MEYIFAQEIHWRERSRSRDPTVWRGLDLTNQSHPACLSCAPKSPALANHSITSLGAGPYPYGKRAPKYKRCIRHHAGCDVCRIDHRIRIIAGLWLNLVGSVLTRLLTPSTTSSRNSLGNMSVIKEGETIPEGTFKYVPWSDALEDNVRSAFSIIWVVDRRKVDHAARLRYS